MGKKKTTYLFQNGKRQVTRQGYENYVKAYQKKQQQFIDSAEEGEAAPEMVSKMMDFGVWAQNYKTTRDTLQDLVKAGKRKTVGNVNQYIVSGQAYEYTYEQTKNLKKATIEAINLDASLSEEEKKERIKDIPSIHKLMVSKDITTGLPTEYISQIYHEHKNELISQGIDPHQAVLESQAYVGWYLFDSDR